jgi:hypothetical protein
VSDIKRECPVCRSYTSSVGIAVANDEPCPRCGTPAAVIREIDATRARLGDEQLKQQVEELLVAAGRTTRELERLRSFVWAVKASLDEFDRVGS